MDRIQIVQLAKRMKTKEDLLALLNQIMTGETSELKARPNLFTMKQLNYYCNPNHDRGRYTQFTIKKKSGGERQITAPRSQTFRWLLRYVNEIFKAMYQPSPYAMGFTEGRSVVDNASRHRGMHYVFNIDLKDFFPSIEQPRVWKRLQLEPFNFPQPVANVLAGLCSMKSVQADGSSRYILPQGAPTSPIITNMICDNLDRRLAGVAKRFGLNYSRYADDITFSSQHNVYQENSTFRTELKRIIEGQGFRINEAKTRLQKLGARQEVTGLIVSEKVNVSHAYVRNVRNILYIWDRYGYQVADGIFSPKYREEKGHIKKQVPHMDRVIEGKLRYLKMVKGENDATFQRLNDKYLRLVMEPPQDLGSDPSPATVDVDLLIHDLDELL